MGSVETGFKRCFLPFFRPRWPVVTKIDKCSIKPVSRLGWGAGPHLLAGRMSMSTPQVEKIIAEMGNRLGANSGLGGTLKFDFGDPGSVYIDGKSAPNTVGDGAGKSADCTITVSLETFEKMVKGELDGTSAFMQGKLRVAGDMGLAMKLGPVLQKARG
jgi:putative sterol carrier protein